MNDRAAIGEGGPPRVDLRRPPPEHAAPQASAALPPARRSEVAVLVPVRDEATTLGGVLDELRRSLPAHTEIIVVDDGSTDGSGHLAEARGIHTIRHGLSRGYGAALSSALRASSARTIAIIDADGTYDPRDLARLLALHREGGMIVGARIVEPNLARRVMKACFRLVVRLTTGIAVPDLNSGMRVFDRTIAERLAAVLPARFSFTTTLTLGALALGVSVTFRPVTFGRRTGRSKFEASDTLAFARTVLRGCGWIRRSRVLEAGESSS